MKAGQSINFQLMLVGRDNLEVDIFYEEELLTRLTNEGQGLYSGNYLVPVVPPGPYTDFRAIASNDEGEVELFTVTLPGVQVLPIPMLSVLLAPTEVIIGESLLFTAEITGFDVTNVETFYLANDMRIPLANLTKQMDNSVDTQVFQGEFLIPSGVPAGQYDQFFAEATDVNNEKLQTPFTQTVTLNTDCATVNVNVIDNTSKEPLLGATISVAGKKDITDSSGQASITQLIDNTEQTLLVTAPGFLPPEPKLIQLNCLAEVNETVALDPTITDCAQLDVTVVDNSELALPIPDALITVASQTSITDEEGKATFTRLIEGPQTINVSADEFFPALPKNIELSCDAVTSELISLTSKKCATAQVRVVNDSGEGIPGAEVSISSITGFTDTEGLVVLENILEGPGTIKVTASGFGSNNKSIELLCDTPASESFILDICAEVDVIVSGSDETRLSGAEVNIGNFFQITGENGTATFTQLNPGIHAFEVSKPGIETAIGTFPLQECRSSPDEIFTPLNVILDTNCATAQVRVVNDSGEGISGAEVSIGSIIGFTDINGFATLNNILEGPHTVSAIASGFGSSIGGDPQVELTCSNENFIPNIILDICAEINVFVFSNDIEGNQISQIGATVNIDNKTFSAETNDSGIATFTKLDQGIHAYEVLQNAFEISEGTFPIQNCRTSPNEVVPQIEVELLPIIID